VNNAPGGGRSWSATSRPTCTCGPLGATLSLLEAAGLEVVDVHSLREHYVWTVRPWLDTLQERRAEAVALIGEEQWRVWLLYLAGGLLAFEENRMGVHQVLMVRPDDRGRSGLPRGRTSTSGRDPARRRRRADG
jgi:cyclopropane-fatty-acyl-phospholipid synthase